MKPYLVSGLVVCILSGLLVLVGWAGHERGLELSRVCALTAPHDTNYPQPLTDRQEIDRICNAVHLD